MIVAVVVSSGFKHYFEISK